MTKNPRVTTRSMTPKTSAMTQSADDDRHLPLQAALASRIDDADKERAGIDGALSEGPAASRLDAESLAAELQGATHAIGIDAAPVEAQSLVEQAAAGSLATGGAGATAAGLSAGAMVGIGAGAIAVGAAAGSGSVGNSGGAAAAAASTGDTTPTSPAPVATTTDTTQTANTTPTSPTQTTPSDPVPTGPSASGVPTVRLAAASNTGSSGDLITGDATPTIEGTGTAGESITVTLSTGGTLSTTVAADGTWSVTPTASLADGSVTFSVVEQHTGLAASAPVTLSVTIDTNAVAGQMGAIGGDDTVNHAEAAALSFGGSGAEAGASLSLLISDGNGHDKTVTAAVGGDGQWSVAAGSLAGLVDGDYTATATVTDSAGNEAQVVRAFVLDATNPATPTAPDLVVDFDSGVSDTDNITSESRPSFAVAAPGVGVTQTLLVDGVATVATYDEALGTLTPDAALADGQHGIAYRVTTASGNSATSTALNVTIDTVQATPVAPDLMAASDFGASDTDNITNFAMPGFAIAALASGETAELFIDSALVQGTYDAAAHSFTPTAPIADGNHYITYWVHDAAGNTSAPSDALTFAIQTVGPTHTITIEAVDDDAGAVHGIFSSGARTDDTTPTLLGSVSAPLQPGQYLQILRDDGVTNEIVGDAVVDGTSWSHVEAMPADGSAYTYTAQVADSFGRNGPLSSSFALTVGPGADIGGSGTDTMRGGTSADTLTGGAGSDALTGDLGSDTFVFMPASASAGGNAQGDHDSVLDFHTNGPSGELDVILLRQVLTFADIGAGAGYAATTAHGTVNVDASAIGGNLVLSLDDLGSGAQSTIELIGRADLYHTDASTTIADLITAGQMLTQST